MYRRMCTLKIFANKIQREERGLVKNTTATTTAKMSTWKAKTIEMCKLILIHSFMYMLMLKFSFFHSLWAGLCVFDISLCIRSGKRKITITHCVQQFCFCDAVYIKCIRTLYNIRILCDCVCDCICICIC